MKKQTNNNLSAVLLYITLALMIVATVSVSILSIARKAKEALPTLPEGTASTEREEPTVRPTQTEPESESTLPESEPTEPVAVTPDDTPVDEPVSDVAPTHFVMPANGHISKGYEAELPVWSVTMEDYRIHDGIDVLCDSDAEVYACADGTVESIYEDPLMGYSVTVYHGGGLRSTYMGLTGEYPGSTAVGAPVSAGQVLGHVGNTALIECIEPKHLHLNMTLDGESVDPMNYLEVAQDQA